MVDFLIVAWGENLILFLFLEGEQEGGQDLRFVEPGGELPLEVGAVLPQPGEEVGRGAGDRDGVVHQSVLVRQDLSEIQLMSLYGPWSWYLSLILFSVSCPSVFEEGQVSDTTRDLRILCILSDMADIPSWSIGRMKTLKELRLSESREPQTIRPSMLVQTLLWRRLWVNLNREADISLSVSPGKTWSHHQLLASAGAIKAKLYILVWACPAQH